VRALDGVIDAVVTERHVAAYGRIDARALERAAAAAAQDRGDASEPRTHVVRARYDGADLREIADAFGLSTSEVVRRHSERTYHVQMVGFLPGFAYLGPLDPSLVLPRRSSPRTRIEPGSIGIAAEYTGIYPFASPGGWNIVARAIDFRLFDETNGATFALGDAVRFEVTP
jgi:UPF0271 protein